MSDRVVAALAKISAGAEPLPEAQQTVDASPADGASGEGSAPADVSTAAPAGGEPASPGATNHDELRAKLEADKNRRLTKQERFRARKEREKAAEERAEFERKNAEADALKAKWSNLGKDGPILDVLREVGRNPQEIYELMKAEALKAGTPEARAEAMQKANDAKFAALAKQLEDERAERAAEKKRVETEAAEARFEADFRRATSEPAFAPLLDEYDVSDLFSMADSLKKNPPYVAKMAEHFGLSLTNDDGSVTMLDIFSVMRAQQAAHESKREQRRKQSAAPHTSQAAPTQAASAKKPTVNGAEERNAGTTIGNDLAAARGGGVDRANETREQRLRRMIAEGKG